MPRALILAGLSLLLVATAQAQHPVGQGLVPAPGAGRVQPAPVLLPPQFQRAVDAGTRTLTGAPGPRYWQNRVVYRLRARLDTDANTLTGEGIITYVNASPDSLPRLVLRLNQNLHRPDVMRNRPVYPTRGMAVTRLAAGGTPLAEAAGLPEPGQYVADGTVLTLVLPEPLAPGDSLDLDVAWILDVPPAGPLAVRNGQDGEVYYLGYWYPQPAVYDDVWGRDTAPYMGLGEHYMPFGTYAVEIDAPADWLVWGTGRLANEADVLAPSARDALRRALAADEIVRVAEAGDASAALAPTASARRVWRFEADSVRDVAFSASNVQRWDATHADVRRDDGTTSRVLINSFYRPSAASWERSAEYARFSVEHLSASLGLPYPWPHMTAVEGIITGGMEYPMMTLIGGERSPQSLFGVTYHEIGHMWYPMIVQTNERAYTWVDEGLTSFNTVIGTNAFFDGSAPGRPVVDGWDRRRQGYYALAGTGFAVPSMTHNDRFPVASGLPADNPAQGSARVVASYSVPTVLMHAMEGSLGRERVRAAYREWTRDWAFKLTTPYDFFHAFEHSLGQDLDWLWTPNLFETWTVDHAVGAVASTPAGVTVTVRDEGLAPFPAPVVVTYVGGRTERQTVSVETWLGGATEAMLTFPAGTVTRVEIDPDSYLPDVDRADNAVDGDGRPAADTD